MAIYYQLQEKSAISKTATASKRDALRLIRLEKVAGVVLSCSAEKRRPV
ncbi:MAG: hypothetical protein JSW39_14435 [Desulfobacterales bacterium]|nr:MAG: hypothetical protein JSW39_14435 [Desulfobacterales bacterium]